MQTNFSIYENSTDYDDDLPGVYGALHTSCSQALYTETFGPLEISGGSARGRQAAPHLPPADTVRPEPFRGGEKSAMVVACHAKVRRLSGNPLSGHFP